MGFFVDLKDAALDRLFPRRCPLCGTALQPNARICGECSDSLEFIMPPICNFCGRPVFDCSCTEQPFVFDRCVSPFVYTKSIRRGMHRFKFNNAPTVASFFARYMASTVRREYKDEYIDIVTCVPMHPLDIRQRGYNQALLLARETGSLLELPVHNNLLVKVNRNSVQHSLTRQERQRNVDGVFEVSRSYRDLRGRTILLCDDIITTGSTLNECARVLREAGAGRVLCVCAAAVVGSAEQSLKRVYVN